MIKQEKRIKELTDPIDRCENCGRGYNDRKNKQEHLCQRCKAEAKKGDRPMNKERSQLRAALKNRTLDEFWEAKDLPAKLVKSYTPKELKGISRGVSKLLAVSLVLLCLGPWDLPLFASQSETQVSQLVYIKAEVTPEAFRAFESFPGETPNLAVIVYSNGKLLFETVSQNTFTAKWDFSEKPIYLSYSPGDTFFFWLVHVPDPEQEQRNVFEYWGWSDIDEPFGFSYNGLFLIVYIFNLEEEEIEEEEVEIEGEGYFEAAEAGIIIQSWKEAVYEVGTVE